MKSLLLMLLLALPVFGQVDPSARLHQLLQQDWEFQMREFPLYATSVGRHDYDDKLPAVARADLERRHDFSHDMLRQLREIERQALSVADQINYDLFQFILEDRIASFRFKTYTIPLNADSGFHTGFARLPFEMSFATVADYDNYIARLRAFPAYVRQQIDNMRRGIKIGMTQPAVTLKGIETSISSHLVEEPAQSLFYTPFENLPESVSAAERRRLTAAGRNAVTRGVIAGYRLFLDFMLGEYIPNARNTIGASEYPEGLDFYAQRIRYYTTLDLSYQEIHATGLAEVKRIRNEMNEIIKQVRFEGTFAEFLTYLRTDPQFYAKSADELLMRAAYISKRMDAKLPSLFRTLPRLPYGVEPVPDHLAPKYTAGRYLSPAFGSTEPGLYWVNTYALESRPVYALEALSLHEAVPGHHLQISLAMEQEDVPLFRRFSYFGAFGEGWGLYSEKLGLEVGFYTDPYSNFGRLTYEMWRACRLVVDTGIHAMGWTRQQALDFLASNTALSLHEVTTETDRYISWPGQALSYKIGELKIRELRKQAEEALGPGFDIRDFHDAVLRNGAVTLTVLEQQITAYIAMAMASGKN